MRVSLDFADIQGNILTGYGRLGFPKGRIMLFHIDNGDSGRRFVTSLLPLITTALRWTSTQGIPTGKIPVPKPEVTVNIAITFEGLAVLGLPTRTLRGMPDEFMDGMAKRAPMLGDDFAGPNWKDSWDEVWTSSGQSWNTDKDRVHILISLFAQMNADGSPVAALDARTREIEGLCRELGGIRLLPGHNRKGQPKQPYQELSALFDYGPGGKPTANYKEHFGFDDGIGDPVFDGQYPNRYEQMFMEGNGALDSKGHWRPLATGEFLLGYPDESQEIAPAALPHAFSRNGTFVVYRKLHENVASFRQFIDVTAKSFGAVFGISYPDDAPATLMAKMAGRWPDGVPLSIAPTVAHWNHFNLEYPKTDPNARYLAQMKFAFRADPEGTKCPLGAHVRRANTRDMLDPLGGSASTINNRRRILRRGMPYGESPEGVSDAAEHGIGMFIYCASLFRQFEFVQSQWINFGFASRSGNDTCPIIGTHSQGQPGSGQGPKAKFVIPADPSSGRPPFIADGIPQFVETRGGEYFFVPSMTALRMIGMRAVDPT
jgi:Dyp-type peroxidase family